MKFPLSRQLVFMTIILSTMILILAGIDRLVGHLEITRELRATFPDRMHRLDRELLFVERSNLKVNVPIFSTLVAPGTQISADSIWHVETNSWGMNEDEFSVKKPMGVYRIVALGDSCTFGWGVPRQSAYIHMVRQELKKRSCGREVETLNAGHTGFTSFQGLKLLENSVLSWAPDCVTVSFGMNDHTIHGPPIPDSQRYAFHRSCAGDVYFLLLRSNIFFLARSWYDRKIAPPSNKVIHVNRVSQEEFTGNMSRMISLVRAAGGIIVIVTQPHQAWTEQDQAYYDDLLGVAHTFNVPLVDCAQRFKELQETMKIQNQIPNRLFLDGIHPTVEGHTIIAEMLAEEMFDLICRPDAAVPDDSRELSNGVLNQ